MIQQPVALSRTRAASEVFQREERRLSAAEQKEEDRSMSEQTKPEANPEELKKEELEGVSGGIGSQSIDWSGPGDEGPEEIVVTKPIKPF
jgi:hypothetical protein